MTVCWAEEEEEQEENRSGKRITMGPLENVTGGILCVDKLEAHIGTATCIMCGLLQHQEYLTGKI